MLEVAARLFGRHGYEATSMDDIARDCGVTKPMLYAYFGSKEGLHGAMIARAGSYLVRTITELSAEKDPTARLHKAADRMIGFIDNYRDSWQMIFSGQGGAHEAPGVAEYRKHILSMTTATFSQVRPRELSKEHAKKLVLPYAHVFLGAAEAGAQWWLTTPGVTIPEVKKLSVDVIDSTLAMVKARFALALRAADQVEGS
jgi:AcrR family transcriptional regulator